MTRYQLACDKRITLAAIVFEIATLIACVLLGDAILENIFQIQTIMASHVSIQTAVIVVLILQYLILATELIARNREDRRGLTLPVAFLPGGIILRTCLMFACELAVIAVKLIAYFLSVLLSFVTQLLRIDRRIGTAHIVDALDRVMEPVEYCVNRLYNLLYFHKIRANTSVFTAVFNGSLSFWCINH